MAALTMHSGPFVIYWKTAAPKMGKPTNFENLIEYITGT